MSYTPEGGREAIGSLLHGWIGSTLASGVPALSNPNTFGTNTPMHENALIASIETPRGIYRISQNFNIRNAHPALT